MSIIITLLIVAAIIFAVIPKSSNKIINPISYSTPKTRPDYEPITPNCFSEQSFVAPVEVTIPVSEPVFDAEAIQKEFEDSNKPKNQENVEPENQKVVLNDIDVTKTLEIKPQTEEVEACVCGEMPSISAFVDVDQNGIDDALRTSYEIRENEEEIYDPSLDVNEPWFASYDITETTSQFGFAEISF